MIKWNIKTMMMKYNNQKIKKMFIKYPKYPRMKNNK